MSHSCDKFWFPSTGRPWPRGGTYARGKTTPGVPAVSLRFYQRCSRASQHGCLVAGALSAHPNLPPATRPHGASASSPPRPFANSSALPREGSRRRRKWPPCQRRAALSGRVPPPALGNVYAIGIRPGRLGDACTQRPGSYTVKFWGGASQGLQSLPLSTIITTPNRVTTCGRGHGANRKRSFDQAQHRRRCVAAAATCTCRIAPPQGATQPAPGVAAPAGHSKGGGMA